MRNSGPIGTPGRPWGDSERHQWFTEQALQRSYKEQVLEKLQCTKHSLELVQYGALSIDETRYPLFAAQTPKFDLAKPTALVTGGVHGYETSGVQGALRFLEIAVNKQYASKFNLVVAPCVSPWAYETINRWNPQAIDPNRSFIANSPAQESNALMKYVSSLGLDIDLHIDLHETTDTDNSEFRPALSARDNVHHDVWEIPDGFYLVGDTLNPCPEFQSAIINAVGRVTHIAPSDASGRIIGELTAQPGVINYATKQLGLCTGFTCARYNTTTEVYPDSPLVDDENCVLAQVAAVSAALEFTLDDWILRELEL